MQASPAAAKIRPAFPYREPREPDRIVLRCCNICFNSCSVKFHHRGERLVRITGNEGDSVLKDKAPGSPECPVGEHGIGVTKRESRSPLCG
jgi:hypothetical protein